MKVEEVKFTKRFNLGNYEHEEISVTVAPDETSTITSLIATLKDVVVRAQAGESEAKAQTETISNTQISSSTFTPAKESVKRDIAMQTEDPAEEKPKRGRKPKVKPGEEEAPTPVEETEEEDEIKEDETGGDGDLSDEDHDDVEEETEEEEEEVVEEKPAPRKTSPKAEREKAAAAKPAEAPAKKVKKVGSPYQRSNEIHRKLLGEMLKKELPGWSKDEATKKAAGETSRKMEGEEFLDAEGEVLSSFRIPFISAVKSASRKK